jgi:hypothetical protein
MVEGSVWNIRQSNTFSPHGIGHHCRTRPFPRGNRCEDHHPMEDTHPLFYGRYLLFFRIPMTLSCSADYGVLLVVEGEMFHRCWRNPAHYGKSSLKKFRRRLRHLSVGTSNHSRRNSIWSIGDSRGQICIPMKSTGHSVEWVLPRTLPVLPNAEEPGSRSLGRCNRSKI